MLCFPLEILPITTLSDWLRRHTLHTFNGSLPGTTRVSRYQNSKTSLNFTEARDSEWQWRQLGHMQVCASLQTDNHTSNPPLSFLQAGCPSCCPTKVSKHWRHKKNMSEMKPSFVISYFESVSSSSKHRLSSAACMEDEREDCLRIVLFCIVYCSCP